MSRRRAFRWAGLSLGAVWMLGACSCPARAEGPPDSVRIGKYRVVAVNDEENGGERAEVWVGGEVVYKTGLVQRAQIARLDSVRGPKPGTDVNGNGVPDVVIYGWSGGAHCCCTVWVIELGKMFAEIAKIDGGVRVPVFRNLDRDLALEVETVDNAFADWPGDSTGSLAPRVVLDWGPSGLEPSCALTFHPLQREKLKARLARLANPSRKDSGVADNEFMREVIRLHYTGHERSGIELLNAVIAASATVHSALDDSLGRRPLSEKRLSEFRSRQRKSAYWPTLTACYGKARLEP